MGTNMTIIWNENLRTRIPTIDEQHQLLFELINKLNKFKTTKKDFYEVLFDLQAYVSVHFQTEEKYMECLSYPGLANHKACHDKFIDDCEAKIKESHTTENFMNLAEELVIFVEEWIQEHYTNEDVKMAKYINKHNLNNSFL